LREQVLLLSDQNGADAQAAQRALTQHGGRVIHQFGPKVQIVELPPGQEDMVAWNILPEALAPRAQNLTIPKDLDEVGALGLQALQHRESQDFAKAKANRKYDGKAWSDGGTEAFNCTDHATSEEDSRALAHAPATSARLTGKVAVGIIIVEGPTKDLQFSAAERVKVISEVQNGLSWLGAQNPAAAVSWSYDIRIVRLNKKPGAGNLSFGQKEAHWRDPAMQQLGYPTGMNGVRQYVEDNRGRLKTNWTYCGFFTKYPVGHFAYASIGGPRLVMHYDNDGWGPDNIDRVFAHETGHIFGAPDEYASACSSSGGQWGYYKKPNGNCAATNPNSVDCIMKGNSWTMCSYTPYHLGFPLAEQRYSGIWRAGSDKHALWVNASWSSFIDKWKTWSGQGLRLEDMKITAVGNTRRYHGVWREGSGGYALWVNANWSDFSKKWQEWGRRGLRLVDLEIVPTNGQNRYSGVWKAGSGGYALWANASYSSFRQKWQQWARIGLRLVDIKVVNNNGNLRYSGVWQQGSGGYGLWVNASWNSFRQKWQEWSRQGLRLIDMEVVVINGQRRYFGVWSPGNDGYGLWVNADWPSFKEKWEEWGKKKYRLIDLEVYAPHQVSSPQPSSTTVLGMEDDSQGTEGMGFLSSTDIVGFEDADLSTGHAELTPDLSPAISNGASQSSGHSNGHSTQGLGGLAESEDTEESDGLGGWRDATVRSNEPQGLGGELHAASSEAPSDGFGGILTDTEDQERNGETESLQGGMVHT